MKLQTYYKGMSETIQTVEEILKNTSSFWDGETLEKGEYSAFVCMVGVWVHKIGSQEKEVLINSDLLKGEPFYMNGSWNHWTDSKNHVITYFFKWDGEVITIDGNFWSPSKILEKRKLLEELSVISHMREKAEEEVKQYQELKSYWENELLIAIRDKGIYINSNEKIKECEEAVLHIERRKNEAYQTLQSLILEETRIKEKIN